LDTKKENLPGSVRSGAPGFSIGNKGYIATGYTGSAYLDDLWEFDPLLNTWTQKANYPPGTETEASAFVINSKAYFGPGALKAQQFWEYDPALNVWTKKANFPGKGQGDVAFAINGKGYKVTGCCPKVQDVWEYDPVLDNWTQKGNFPGTARIDGVGFAIGNKGYFGLGQDNSGYDNDFWQYDPGTDTWTAKASFPGGSRVCAIGFSMGQKGYAGTGSDLSFTMYNDFWEYNPCTDSWIAQPNFPGIQRYFAISFSIGLKGYIGTGWGNGWQNDLWEFRFGNTPLGTRTVCRGDSTILTASAGTNYLWSTGDTTAAIIVHPDTTTTYWIVISTTTCSSIDSTITVIVKPGPVIDSITTSNATCGTNTGVAVAHISGGTGTLTYSWSTGSTGTTASNLAAGTYSFSVKDNNNCSTTKNVSINNSPGPKIDSIVPVNILCKGHNTGVATVYANGAGALTYNWSTGSTSRTVNNLSAKTYTVTVTDGSSCIAIGTIALMQPLNKLVINSVSISNSICGKNNGAASVSATGGSGRFNYNWSTGSTASTVNGLNAGIYSVTVTDANGCTIDSLLTVGNDPGPSVSTQSISTCQGRSDGIVTVNVTGASGPYIYSWSNGSSTSTSALSNSITSLTVGTYIVTVSDANGCTSTTFASVNQFAAPTASAGSPRSIINGQRIQLGASGGVSYLWSPTTSLDNSSVYNPYADPAQTTSYTVTVTDINNCTASSSVLITVTEPVNCDSLKLFLPTAFSPNGDGHNDVLYVHGTVCLNEMRFNIYNRWGELVFSTTSPAIGWDGNFNGKAMDAGVFVYYLTGTFQNGQSISEKGNITLLR